MTERFQRVPWVVAAALSIGAGVIHFALGPEHVVELGPLGYGFYVSGALQVGWAAILALALLMPRGRDAKPAFRKLVQAGIAINVAILAAWAISRVVGLPAGETPWTPEAIGRPDAIGGILEGVLTLGLLGSLRNWTIGPVTSSRWFSLGAALALSAIVVGTVVAITPDDADQMAGHDQGPGTMMMTPEGGRPG